MSGSNPRAPPVHTLRFTSRRRDHATMSESGPPLPSAPAPPASNTPALRPLMRLTPRLPTPTTMPEFAAPPPQVPALAPRNASTLDASRMYLTPRRLDHAVLSETIQRQLSTPAPPASDMPNLVAPLPNQATILESSPPPQPAAASNMPTLRSQGEFFMTGVLAIGAVPDSECSICMEKLDEDVVKMVACQHCYHCVCILAWFNGGAGKNRKCPLCRMELYSAAPRGAPALARMGGARSIYDDAFRIEGDRWERPADPPANMRGALRPPPTVRIDQNANLRITGLSDNPPPLGFRDLAALSDDESEEEDFEPLVYSRTHFSVPRPPIAIAEPLNDAEDRGRDAMGFVIMGADANHRAPQPTPITPASWNPQRTMYRTLPHEDHDLSMTFGGDDEEAEDRDGQGLTVSQYLQQQQMLDAAAAVQYTAVDEAQRNDIPTDDFPIYNATQPRHPATPGMGAPRILSAPNDRRLAPRNARPSQQEIDSIQAQITAAQGSWIESSDASRPRRAVNLPPRGDLLYPGRNARDRQHVSDRTRSRYPATQASRTINEHANERTDMEIDAELGLVDWKNLGRGPHDHPFAHLPSPPSNVGYSMSLGDHVLAQGHAVSRELAQSDADRRELNRQRFDAERAARQNRRAALGSDGLARLARESGH